MEIEIHYGFQIFFSHRSEASKKKGENLVAADHVRYVRERKLADFSDLWRQNLAPLANVVSVSILLLCLISILLR